MRLTGSIFSSLYNNENPSQTPDWIAETDFQFTEKQALDIDFDNRTIAQEKIQVNRDTRDYSAKKLTAKLNNNEVMLSKVELSKFLSDKHYQIKEANKTDKQVVLKTLLNNIPGSFEFIYDINNNHIVQGKLFNYNDTQYPFNKAGLEECINDIKKNKITAKKVENTTGAIITAEEIYRRYNGHIRKATDRINQLLKEEAIIGVGSNKFGTFYDINYLFPQEDKESIKQEPAFEFVQNLEKVAATPHKSAYQLTMEASKLLENNFDDFKIIDYKRNNNTLTVQAKVLKDNNSKLQIFDFDIKDENIVTKDITANINGSNYTNKYNKYISEQNIINKQAVKDILTANGYINANIDNIFNTLKANKTVTQIDNNNYISSNTIEEIFNNNTHLFGQKDIKTLAILTDKVEDLRLAKQNVKDTGIRAEFEHKTSHQLLMEASKLLKDNFDDFKVIDYKRNNNTFVINASVLDNGVTREQEFKFGLENEKIINNNISNIQTKTFNKASKINNTNIIRKNTIRDILTANGYLNADVDNIFKIMKADKAITEVSKDKYNSVYDINTLLNKYMDLFGECDIEDYYKLSNKSNDHRFNKENVIDTKTRQDYNKKTIYHFILQASQQLQHNFDDFDILEYSMSNNKLFVKAKVLKNDIVKIGNFGFIIKNNKLQAKKFKDIASNTIKHNSKFNDKNIISKKHINTYLKDNGYFNYDLDNVFNVLAEKNIITQIDNNNYVSKYNFTQLFKYTKNLIGLQNKEKLSKLLDKHKQFRKLNEFDTGKREIKAYVTDETTINAINDYLLKYFDDFNVLDFNVYDNDNHKSIIYNIETFNADTGLTLNLSLNIICENNIVRHCFTEINGEQFSLNDITNALSISDTLNNYLKTITNKQVKSDIIFSKQELKNKLLTVAHLSNIDDTIQLLKNKEYITEIGLNKYASKYTIAELINRSNLKALNDNEINAILKKQQVNKNTLQANYINDNDTRDMIDNWTVDETRIYIMNQISKLFKRFEILDININQDNYIITINGTDDDGLNKNMIVYFDIDKNHPSIITNITRPNSNETIQEYLNYNQPNTYNSNGIITQKQLEQQLLEVIDIKEFNDILDMLLNDGVIVPLSANQYKLNNTMSEIVGYIDKKKKTNITANKNKLLSAVKAYDVTDTIITNDSDTRTITQQQELSLAGKVARKRIINNLTNAYNNKMITQNKYNTLLTKTKTANSERTLSEVENELKKYL